MATQHPHKGPPHALHSVLELRVFQELATLPLAWPLLMNTPKGDGHPVLLSPGFMGDEGSLFALKRFLKTRGYEVHTWGLGRNVGFQRRHAEALVQKIRHLHHQSGRTVSLVGWSLGGMFSLYGALHAPECVRHLITLGSPVTVDPVHGSQSPETVKRLYRLIAHPLGPSAHIMQPRVKRLRERELPNVPISCLYSISDGVVPAQEATITGDPSHCENIRVYSSHIGLGFNAMVLAILADRLSQPEGDWKPFDPQGVNGMLYRAATHAAVPI
ncbi:MAG: alpha/beta hydrolase [Acidovorax sp.]|uniref:esterase/lipase family protein n=1 Tax=Acidovorax sp. TaxID=1872122 RepID=UPI0039E717C4